MLPRRRMSICGQGWDLVVTMDDATSGVYSGFFVEEEGTWSSLRGVAETVKVQGLFDSLYTDRGSHYWHTPEAGGKVDKDKPTQFGRAMGELGIEMIAAYSPQARGRSERLFGTLQGRLPQELARAGITDMDEANEFLKDFWPRFNAAFAVEAREAGWYRSLHGYPPPSGVCGRATTATDPVRPSGAAAWPQPVRDILYVRATVSASASDRKGAYEPHALATSSSSTPPSARPHPGRMRLTGPGRSSSRVRAAFHPHALVQHGDHLRQSVARDRGEKRPGLPVLLQRCRGRRGRRQR